MVTKQSRKLDLIKTAIPRLRELASPCRLCGHRCKAERAKGKKGLCRSSSRVAVYSYSPHHGEEPPLSGHKGSGTIFFTHCNMKCVYCQNYAFSQESNFREIETGRLADIMLELQNTGCHNINLVSPTHYAYQIVEALGIAIKKSLDLPVVYNTGGYDSPELIRLLGGIVDIYLPDMRYSRDETAEKYSSAPRYASNNRIIIKEMFRQVGPLKVDKNGIAESGVIVRLLILPGNASGTVETLKFLKEGVSDKINLSVMSQYHPAYKAEEFPAIARRINKSEYGEVVEEAEKLKLTNGWIQGFLTDTGRFMGTKIKARK